MLVLSRHEDESIVIDPDGQNIIIKVIRIYDGKVKLGILAPPEIAVHRTEIADRIALHKRRLEG